MNGTEIKAVEGYKFIEILAEFKGLLFGIGISLGFAGIRLIIEKLTGI